MMIVLKVKELVDLVQHLQNKKTIKRQSEVMFSSRYDYIDIPQKIMKKMVKALTFTIFCSIILIVVEEKK